MNKLFLAFVVLITFFCSSCRRTPDGFVQPIAEVNTPIEN